MVNFLLAKVKPIGVDAYLTLFFKTTPYLLTYAFFLYFLEMENYLDTGWAFYALLFFLVPLIVIALLVKIIFWIGGRRSGV
jgi:heme/copper-type cytochrome/quinol oxidase subunit 4